MAIYVNESDHPGDLNLSEIQPPVTEYNGTAIPLDNVRWPNATTKIAYSSVAALGILGNLIVIIVISKSTRMRKTYTNILILNQSCIDFMASVFIMITAMRKPVGNLSGLAGDIYCKLWLTDIPMWSLLISSSYSLIALTVERYVAVVHPIFHHNSFSKKKVVTMAVASWFPGFMDMLPLMVPTSGVVRGRCFVLRIPSPAIKKVCGVILFVVQYLIPITVFLTCYTRIVLYLRSRVSPRGQASGNEVAVQKARASRNVLRTLVTIVVCYVICNSWNQFTFLAFNFGYPLDFSTEFYHFTVIALYVNSCINPIIYAMKYELFQKEFRKLFCKCGGTVSSDSSTLPDRGASS